MSLEFGTVYALHDPIDGRVRYVGKTKIDPLKRLQQHLGAAAKGRHAHVYCWIRSLEQKPVLKVLETGLPLDQLNDRERFWISEFDDLTNLTLGGDGGIGTRSHKPECKCSFCGPSKHRPGCKCSWCGPSRGAGMTGKKHSAKTRAKMSKTHSLYRHSPEAKAKIAESNRRRARKRRGVVA